MAENSSDKKNVFSPTLQRQRHVISYKAFGGSCSKEE